VKKLTISEAVPIVAKFTSDDSIRLVQQVSDTYSSSKPRETDDFDVRTMRFFSVVDVGFQLLYRRQFPTEFRSKELKLLLST
jgi:hypothetical protein